MSQDCVYLGKEQPGKVVNDLPVHDCRIHGQCTPGGRGRGIAGCHGCRERLTLGDADLPAKWRDPLRVRTSAGEPCDHLRHTLQGGIAFLVCGGPSSKQLPLESLNRRGCWSLCVNNTAAYDRFRPQAFVCSDPPEKFCHQIWLDAAIAKFIPLPKLTGVRNRLRRKLPPDAWVVCDKCGGKGKREQTDKKGETKVKTCPDCVRGTVMFTTLIGRGGKPIRSCDAPNVWGFGRRSWILPDETFFTHQDAAWGNQNDGVLRTGGEKTVNTTLLGLRLLYYLGARRIYLVGVDFFMDPARGEVGNYAFPEVKEAHACNSNNHQFSICNQWLCDMAAGGVFDRFGLEVYNTYEFSGLRAFPYVPFELAVADATADLGPIDTQDWYAK